MLLTLFSDVSRGQDEVASEKAQRYHSALLKRPSGGYLFDRFLNTWLDTGTVDGVDQFLKGKAASDEAVTADRLLYGYFLSKMGREDEALAVFEQALEAEPENGEAWAEAAKARARRLDFDNALVDLESALKFTDDEKALIELGKFKGRWLSRSGKTTDAIKAWNALVEQFPDDDELREDLVELQLAESLVDEALETQKGLVEATRDPYHKITRKLRLGDIYLRSGEAEKAKAIYTESLDAAGRDTWLEKEIIAQIDRLFRKEDDISGLKKHYQSVLEASSGRIAVQRRLAMVHAELDEADEAIAVFRELLKMTPGDRGNREDFITLLGRLEQTDEAVKQMEALAASYPEDAELKAQLAIWQNDANQKDAAEASVGKFLEQSDQTEYSYLRAARLLERFELNEAAAKTFNALVDAFPDSSGAVDEMAAFLYRSGKKEEAFEMWKEIAASGSSPDAIRAARMLGSRGERESAYQILLERAEEFTTDFVYLGRLCAEALASGHAKEVLPWMEKRLSLAENPADFSDALRQALSVLNQAEETENYREMLTAKKGDLDLSESCLLAALLDRNSEYDAATEILSSWIDKGELLAISQRIRQLESRDEWAEAAKVMEGMVALPEGKRSNNIERLISLYGRAMNTEKAFHWIAEWKKISPGSSQPWLMQAQLLHEDNETEKAIEVLRQTVGRFEDEESARVLLASLYSQSGKSADAERIYWSLYEESEDISGKLRWVGRLTRSASERGNVERLIEQLQERKRANRTSIAPLLSIAEVHRQTDNYEGRREALLEATRLRPEDLSLLHQIARIEETEGDWEKSAATLETALALDKTDDTKKRIALLHLRYGDEEEGYRRFIEISGGDDMDAKTVIGLADAMIARNGWERALSLLNQYGDRFPDDYQIGYLHAIALEESQATEEAREAFLRLLDHDVEMKKASTSAQTNAVTMASQINTYTGKLPEGAADLMGLNQYRYYGFSYRSQLRSGRVRFQVNPSTGSSGLIRLPSSLSELHSYSTVHLHGLSAWMDGGDDAVEHLGEEMEARGVEYAKILLATVPSDSYSNTNPITDETLEKFPGNEVLLTTFVNAEAGNLGNRQATSYPDELLKASDELLESYPHIAFLAAITAASSNDETAFDKVAELLDSGLDLGEVPPSILRTAASNLLLNFANDGFPEGLRAKLITRIEEWRDISLAYYAEKNKKSGNSATKFVSPGDRYAAVLRKSADLSAYVSYLDEQMAKYDAAIESEGPRSALATQSGFGNMLRYLLQNKPLIAQFDFPPVEAPGIPGNVIEQFITISSINFGYQLEAFDLDEVARMASEVESPWLSAFFLAVTDNQEEVSRIVDEQMRLAKVGGKRLSLKDAFLGAGWYQKVEQWEKAASLLEEVRLLPMSRQLRQRIDANLVFCAKSAGVEAAGKPGAGGMAEWGPSAALRLRYGFLSANQRGELVTALEDFGLKDEANRLLAKGKVAPTTSSSNYVQSNVVAGFDDQIKKLVSDGKSERAVELLAKSLKQNTGLMVASGGGRWDHNITNLIRNMRSSQMSVYKKAAESLRPGEDAEAKDHLHFAFLKQLEADVETSSKHFDLAFDKLSDSRKSKYLGTAAITKSCFAPEEALSLFKLVKQNQYAGFNNWLSGVERPIEYAGSDLENRARINLAKGVTLWLKDSTDSFRKTTGDLGWIENSVRSNLQASMENMPNIFATGLYQKIQRSGSKTDQVAERDAVHKELCLIMMDIPQLAHQAFYCYSAQAIKEAPDLAFRDPENRALALKALENHGKRRSTGPASLTRRNGYIRAEFLPRWEPGEFLLWNAFLEGGEGDAILESLRKAKDPGAFEAAKAFHGMLFGDAEVFESSLKKYLNQKRYLPASHSYSYAGEQVLGVVKAVSAKANLVWEARRETLADQFSIIDFLTSDISRGKKTMQAESTIFAGNLVTRLTREKGWAAAEPLFIALCDEWLGDDANWDRFVKVDQAQGGYRSSNYTALEHRQFAGFLSLCGWNPHTVFHVLRFVNENDLDDDRQVSDSTMLASLDNSVIKSDFEVMKALYMNGPFMADVAGFDSLRTDHEKKPAMVTMLDTMRQSNAEKKEEFKNLLSESETFGAELSRAYWDKGTDPNLVVGCIEKYSDEIKNMTEKQLYGLGAVIESAYPKGVPNTPESEKASEILDLLGAERERTIAESVDEFLAFKNLKSNGLDYSSKLVRKIGPLIDLSLKSGSFELAEKVYWHALVLINKEQRTGGWGSYDSAWNAHGSFLYDLVDDIDAGGIERIAFYERLLRQDTEGKIALSPPGKFSAFLKTAFVNHGGEKNLEKALNEVFADLLDQCGAGVAPDTLAMCCEYFPQKLRPNQMVACVAWADKTAAKEGPLKPLAAAFSMAWRRGLSSNEPKGFEAHRKKIPEIDSWIPYTMGLLGSDQHPHSWRVSLAGRSSRVQLEKSSPELVLAAAEAMAAGLSADAAFNGWRYAEVIKRFTLLPRDEKWAEVAELVDSGWVYKNRNNGRDHNTGLPWDPWDDPVFLTLDMYGMLGDAEKMKRFLNEDNVQSRINRNARAFHCLARHGFVEEALKELDRSLAEVDIGTDYPVGGNDYTPFYTSELHEKVDPVLEAIEEGPKRFFAELLLRGTPDLPNGKKEKDPPYPFRHKRIYDLAVKFKETDFAGSDTIRESALRQFAEYDNSSELLKDEIVEIAKSFDMEATLATQNRDKVRYRVRFPAAKATFDLKQGNIGEVRKFILALRDSSAREYYREEALEYFSARIANSVKNRHPYMDGKEIQGYADALHLLLAVPDGKILDHDQFKNVVVAKVLVDVLALRDAESKTVLQTTEFSKARLALLPKKLAGSNTNPFWNIMTGGLKLTSPNPDHRPDDETRQQLISGVLTHHLVSELVKKESDLWGKLEQHKWAKPEEKDSEWAKTLMAELEQSGDPQKK